MIKAIVIFGSFLLGGLLMATAIFGMVGMWDKFLFVSLEPLRTSWEWPVGLIVAAFGVWFFGGIAMRAQ